MLSWRISFSEKLNGLSSDTARLLFTWLIPHCDNFGRMSGEPAEVKAVVFPKRADLTPERIGTLLVELHDAGLITMYVHEGLTFVHVRTWQNWNKISGNMSRESDYPEPPERVQTRTNTFVHVSPEGEVEGKGESKDLPPPPRALGPSIESGNGRNGDESAVKISDSPKRKVRATDHPEHCVCEDCYLSPSPPLAPRPTRVAEVKEFLERGQA